MNIQKPHVFLGTPMHTGQCYGDYFFSVLDLQKLFFSKSWKLDVDTVYYDSLVTSARNDLVNVFLESSATHLLFIDADISFNPKDIVKMLQEDVDVICGCYPIKSIDWNRIRHGINNNASNDNLEFANRYVFSVEDNENPSISIGSEQLKKIKYGGTGFMLIKREVFSKIKNSVSYYTGDKENNLNKQIINFFQTEICEETRVLLPEDYFFCQQWKKQGGEIFLAQYAFAQHHGNYTFGSLLLK